MSEEGNIRKVSYICGECGQKRNLSIDKDVHLQRRELEINGLASYIDVHARPDGTNQHGVKLFIDHNFHVRTNNILKIKSSKTRSPANIPLPGFKTKNITTVYEWDSWVRLELEIASDNLKFVLEPPNENEHRNLTVIETASDLGTVTCTVHVAIDKNSALNPEYIKEWITKFCNSLELASSIHVDLIPEVLRYIDHHVHRKITYFDGIVIAILIDKASILIPDKETMQMIAKYGPAMSLIGLDPEKLSAIAKKLCEFDQFSMIDIQKILESELEKDTELEEEFIILSLFYLLSLDSFDYKLSYVQTIE